MFFEEWITGEDTFSNNITDIDSILKNLNKEK